MLLLCGIPLLYMELAVGQYTRRGPIGALGKICPLLKGAGLSTVIMSFLLTTYYNVIMSWALFYLVYSFSPSLPWETCDNYWNSPSCRPIKSNVTMDLTTEMNNTHSSTQEFYDLRMLRMTEGIENMGGFSWELLAALCVAWTLVYFAIWKSVKVTGKVVYFTATFPCILCGVCVFSPLGSLAYSQGTTVDNVVTQGPGLVFVVFPHALSQLPLPQLWAVIFFLMLVFLGIDSQFAMVEVVITSLTDSYKHIIDKYLRHEVMVLFVCVFSMLCGIPNLFEGGIYFFQIIDYYTAAISLMYIALFETIAIVWLYGVRRLSANIEDMTGRKPSIIFRICWMFVSPVLILVIWVFTLYDYE